jgi:ketosteroid isomerase-like protein
MAFRQQEGRENDSAAFACRHLHAGLSGHVNGLLHATVHLSWRKPGRLLRPMVIISGGKGQVCFEEIAMGENENVALVRKGYEAFLRGDIDALMELFADDVEWELDRNEAVPFTGLRRGKEEVAEFFRLVNEHQHALQFEPREFVAQGDKVVALGHYAWSVKPTDRTWESDFAEVFTIRDGKIAGFREFSDTKVADEAYRMS